MVVHTTRFGNIEICKDDVFLFSEGLLGFNQLRKFVLLDDENDAVFAWLQSCESAGVAFPILEPELFCDDYTINLAGTDLNALAVENLEGCKCFSIITIPEDPTQMTANLKAPIIINVEKKIGRQCVLQENKFAIREMIFSTLQKRVVQNPQINIKSKALDWGVAISLPEVSILEPKNDPGLDKV